MNKIHGIILALVGVIAQPIFANVDDVSSKSKACQTVANACRTAGFDRTAASGKKFWQDCMKPILLNNTVAGVTIDSQVVDNCRMDKINELRKELNDLQTVVSTH